MRPLRSLQGRLLALVLGAVSLLWLSAAVLTWIDVRHELDELLDSHLAQAAALLVVQQVHDIEDGHRVQAPQLHRHAPKVAFQVFHEGRLVLRSAQAPAQPLVPRRDGSVRDGFHNVEVTGRSWRVFVARGAERDVQVFVGEQTQSRQAILWAALRSTLWPMLAALPLLGLAVWWAVRRGVAPLRRLGHTLARRQAEDLQPLEMDNAPAEMRPMLDALNGLFQRTGTLLDSERRFTADAAHELRTPIAAIRAQAQVALGEADAAARRHALQSTLEGCDRAARLVDQLLQLSRLEASLSATRQPVDLVAVARQVVADLAPAAMARRQSVELEAVAHAQVRGDDTLLAVLVRNLVDNAMRYSPVAAQIRVRVESRGQQVIFGVEDSGPGLAETDRMRLGDRFFRVTGTNESGSGLGWSIVRRVAGLHGARIGIGPSAPLGGLEVTVAFERVG